MSTFLSSRPLLSSGARRTAAGGGPPAPAARLTPSPRPSPQVPDGQQLEVVPLLLLHGSHPLPVPLLRYRTVSSWRWSPCSCCTAHTLSPSLSSGTGRSAAGGGPSAPAARLTPSPRPSPQDGRSAAGGGPSAPAARLTPSPRPLSSGTGRSAAGGGPSAPAARLTPSPHPLSSGTGRSAAGGGASAPAARLARLGRGVPVGSAAPQSASARSSGGV